MALAFSPLKQRLGWLVGGKTVICHPTYQGLKSIPQPGPVTQSLGITPHGEGVRQQTSQSCRSSQITRKGGGVDSVQARQRGDSPPHPRISQASLPDSDSMLPSKIPAPPPRPGFPLQPGQVSHPRHRLPLNSVIRPLADKSI